ncbi:MAG: PAS domain-containing protein, partial [Oscillospiraceae bacterium]
MELAALLKQTRHAIGMTQVQIAQALHLSFSTINRWENGRARPNPLAAVTVLALAREKNAPPELLERLEAALWGKNGGGDFPMSRVDKSLLGETISDSLMVRTTEPGFPVQYIGEGIARLLGYASAAALARALDEKNCIHPDDLRFMTEGIRQQLEDGGKYAIEYRVRRKDGSYIWVQDHGKRVRAAEGNEYVLSTYYDLSGQSQARADESRLYGDIVRQSTDGVYVLEQGSYRLLYANDAMENIFKSVGIHDYQGKKCHCVLRNRTQPCADCFAYPSTKAGEPREIYVDFLSRYYAVRSHSVEWRGRPATVIYLSDISERKRSRYELAKTQKKLAAAIDHAGLAYWEYDILNSRAYLNTISTSEYTLDEIIENYPATLYETDTIHPDSIALYDSLIEEVKNGQPTAQADIKTIDAKGNLVWKRVRFTTLFDEGGKPFWAVATAESIDDYKSLESRFTTVLEQNQIDTWMYDIPRRTIIQNHNTEEVYGVHGAEIPDVPESLIAGKQCHPEDVECFRDFYRRLHQGETQVSATVRLWDIRTEDYIWKRCTYSILPNRNGEPLYALGSAVEINDQMETERKYEEAIQYHYRTLGENVILA